MEITIARGQTVAIRAYAERLAEMVKADAERRFATVGCIPAAASELHLDALHVAHLCNKYAEHFELEPACVGITLGSQHFSAAEFDMLRNGQHFDWQGYYAAKHA